MSLLKQIEASNEHYLSTYHESKQEIIQYTIAEFCTWLVPNVKIFSATDDIVKKLVHYLVNTYDGDEYRTMVELETRIGTYMSFTDDDNTDEIIDMNTTTTNPATVIPKIRDMITSSGKFQSRIDHVSFSTLREKLCNSAINSHIFCLDTFDYTDPKYIRIQLHHIHTQEARWNPYRISGDTQQQAQPLQVAQMYTKTNLCKVDLQLEKKLYDIRFSLALEEQCSLQDCETLGKPETLVDKNRIRVIVGSWNIDLTSVRHIMQEDKEMKEDNTKPKEELQVEIEFRHGNIEMFRNLILNMDHCLHLISELLTLSVTLSCFLSAHKKSKT
jgi:hypothetical protein